MFKLVIGREYAEKRTFATNWQISEKRTELFTPPFTDVATQQRLEGVGVVGTKLLLKIFKIKGIDSVWIGPEKLEVVIGAAYEWEDIMPAVRDAVIESNAPDAATVINRS